MGFKGVYIARTCFPDEWAKLDSDNLAPLTKVSILFFTKAFYRLWKHISYFKFTPVSGFEALVEQIGGNGLAGSLSAGDNYELIWGALHSLGTCLVPIQKGFF